MPMIICYLHIGIHVALFLSPPLLKRQNIKVSRILNAYTPLACRIELSWTM